MSADPAPAAGMSAGHALVAGGGIGGLAAALGLARAGLRVTVLERAAAFGEVGAGVQLGPNAFAALDALGVGDAARTIAVVIDQLRLMDAMAGEEIAHIDLTAPFRERFGNPYAVVHRGELHGVLLRACAADPAVTLRTRAAVDGYRQDAGGVDALSGGEGIARGDVLIGADGLRSRIRAQMHGDAPPRIAGHTTYRSVIPLEAMPEDLRWNAATLWAGARCHLVHYPLTGWTTFNLAITAANDPPEMLSGKPVTHAEVMEGFRDVHPRARALIEHGRDWRAWVICDRDPVEDWTDGRVALLGDAAHPMLQYFAQGACMALEDAVALADELGRDGGASADGLERYNRRRSLRAARVQLTSRALGEHVYHPAGPHAALRDAMFRAKTQAQFYDGLAWLYDGERGDRTSRPPATRGVS